MPLAKKSVGKRKHGRQRPNCSNTSPLAIKTELKKKEALEYRLQSYSFKEIAEAMKCSVPTAFRYVANALHEIARESAEQVLVLEAAKLDMMESAIAAAAFGGDINAQVQVLRIMERRAKLLGYDKAPDPKDEGPREIRINVVFVDAPATTVTIKPIKEIEG